VIVNQAYRFALDPTPAQERVLASHAGASPKAFNWALRLIKAQLDQRHAERSYGLTGAELTPLVPWTVPALRKRWNQVKVIVAPWWAECSKEAYAAGIRNLVRGLDAWRDSKSGKRQGPPVRFPRFKSKRRETVSCTFTTGAIRIGPDRRHVTLPRLGMLRLHESARKLARRVEAGTARILSATVKREVGRWFVSFACEVDKAGRIPARPDAVVGVDVGVSRLAVLSTGGLSPTRATWPPRAGTCVVPRAGCRAVQAPTGAPTSRRRSGGSAPRPSWAARTRGWRTCAATACTSSHRAWPPPTAPLSWSA
jgi:transposase